MVWHCTMCASMFSNVLLQLIARNWIHVIDSFYTRKEAMGVIVRDQDDSAEITEGFYMKRKENLIVISLVCCDGQAFPIPNDNGREYCNV